MLAKAQKMDRLFTLEEIIAAQQKLQERTVRMRKIMSIGYALLVVASVAVLLSLLLLPILKVTGTSMEPNLNEGEVVIATKTEQFETGDVISFRYNNRQLIKRVIATAGDWVIIEEDGTVFVNGRELDEPYIQNKSLGFNDLSYPYQVPDETVFVLGDHRDTSIDSRSNQIGPVSQEDIEGEILCRIWPLNRISSVE